jgi:hypothetical protein
MRVNAAEHANVVAVAVVNPHISKGVRKMLKAARVSVLILLLAGSTQAGYIPNGLAQPTPTPTPAPTYFVEEEPTDGETNDEVTVVLAEAALSVLNTVLALL